MERQKKIVDYVLRATMSPADDEDRQLTDEEKEKFLDKMEADLKKYLPLLPPRQQKKELRKLCVIAGVPLKTMREWGVLKK